jgi:glycosyltransferase-like protein
MEGGNRGAPGRPLRVALCTYSTRARGGVVHSIQLAEALHALGHEVRLFALEKPGRSGFFRPIPVPATFIPVAEVPGESVDDKIPRYIDAYVDSLRRDFAAGAGWDVFHAEDCISGNALVRLREEGLVPAVVRTVHHTDEFTSPGLISCQHDSIVLPDLVLVVSRWWQRRLREEYGIEAPVVHNGVDLVARRPPASEAEREADRRDLGLDGTVAVLAVGGVEPRKNTLTTLRAVTGIRERLARATGRTPVLVIVGGETLFDYREYRDAFDRELASLVATGALPADAVRILGPVEERVIAACYRAADVLAFPSIAEGWGLVVLEAQASGLPVVASDIEVLHEYLVDGENALLVPPSDAEALGSALLRVAADPALASQIRTGGLSTAQRFGWRSSAERHAEVYRRLLSEGDG